MGSLNNTVMKIGRRAGGSWGRPHKQTRRAANRGSRAILKRLLKGGRSQLLRED